MGYWKTLMLDAGAARGYQQRYERLTHNDQAKEPRNSHLVIDRKGHCPATTAPLAGSMPLTREAVGKALRHYRKQVAGNDRDTNALNRAALNIEACLWTWNGDELIVTSASSSRTRYHVTATTCECRAAASGFVCWHRWAWMVLDTARHPQAPQQPAQRGTEDVQKAVDELF